MTTRYDLVVDTLYLDPYATVDDLLAACLQAWPGLEGEDWEWVGTIQLRCGTEARYLAVRTWLTMNYPTARHWHIDHDPAGA